MANNKKNKKEELVTARKSVHVIFLSCPHCGIEKDHIEMCGDCNEAMRVIDVVEKFGEDADRFLERVEKRKAGKQVQENDEDYVSIDKEEPNIILMGNQDALNGDNGIDPNEDDDASLVVIFPDDDDSAAAKETVIEADDELTKALEQLDAEEDDDLTAEDFGFDDGEIPTL